MFQNGGQASLRLAAIQFELLPQIAEIAELAEIASSLAMSNIWPERGASCLKRLQTRLSGPDPYSPVCKLNKLIESAVFLRNKKKNRRKLPPKVPVETETFVAVPYSVDSARGLSDRSLRDREYSEHSFLDTLCHCGAIHFG